MQLDKRSDSYRQNSYVEKGGFETKKKSNLEGHHPSHESCHKSLIFFSIFVRLRQAGVRATLKMLRALDRINAWSKHRSLPQVSIRCGVHTGEVPKGMRKSMS